MRDTLTFGGKGSTYHNLTDVTKERISERMSVLSTKTNYSFYDNFPFCCSNPKVNGDLDINFCKLKPVQNRHLDSTKVDTQESDLPRKVYRD